jgi:hypothetical protein
MGTANCMKFQFLKLGVAEVLKSGNHDSFLDIYIL